MTSSIRPTCSRPVLTPEQESEKALALFGMDTSDHLLLHENVSQYIFNLETEVPWDDFETKEEASEWLMNLATHLKTTGNNEQKRWPKKIARELDSPYRDSEMPAYIKNMQADFESSVKKFRSHYPKENLKFFVTGSPLYGRFGGNSDIDAVTLQVDNNASDLARSAQTGEIAIGTFPREGYLKLPCSPDAAELPLHKPWAALDELIVDNWREKGLLADQEGGAIKRVAFPARKRDRSWLQIPDTCEHPSGPDVQDRD